MAVLKFPAKAASSSTAVVDNNLPVVTQPSPPPVTVEEHEEVEAAFAAATSLQQPAPEAASASTAAEPAKPAEPNHHIFYFVYEAFLLISRAIAFSIAACLRYLVRYPLHAFFNAGLIVLLGLTIFTGSEINKQLILGQISDNTVNEILKVSRFTREFDAEDVDRSMGRELLRVGAPIWAQRESVQAVLYHARKVGLSLEDQAVLLSVVDIESGFNPFARAATTSACGLFQFVKRTGELFGLAQSNCMDPWKNAEAGVAHYLYNFNRRVQPSIAELQGPERLFKTFELSYYLHHDGPESSNPNNDVKATILEGTQFLFKVYRVLQEEQGSQTRVPSFAERFSQNFWRMVETVKGWSWRSNPHNGALELGANAIAYHARQA